MIRIIRPGHDNIKTNVHTFTDRALSCAVCGIMKRKSEMKYIDRAYFWRKI